MCISEESPSFLMHQQLVSKTFSMRKFSQLAVACFTMIHLIHKDTSKYVEIMGLNGSMQVPKIAAWNYSA